MTEVLIVSLDRSTTQETWLKLRDYAGVVVMETEFNTDTQLYELAFRYPTIEDL